MEAAPRCPRCDVEFATGRLSIRGTITGFLFFGMSRQHLWWTDADGSRRRVLDSWKECSAGECPSCGLIAFRPPSRQA